MKINKCFRCLKSDRIVKLLDAVYGNEIVNVCEQCALVEDVPIIRKPSSFQLKESNKPYTVLERLSKMAGLTRNEKVRESHRETITLDKLRKPKDYAEILRQKEELAKKRNRPIGLIDNYNWHMQRARRARKMALSQLSEAVGEPEIALMMVERGILPDNADSVIKKIEQYFKINLRKASGEEVKKNEKENIETKMPVRVLSFNSENLKNLTIADLQKLKEQRVKIEKEEADKEIAAKLAWRGKTKEEREEIKKGEKEEKIGEESQIEKVEIEDSYEEKKSKKSFWDIFRKKSDKRFNDNI